MFNVNRKNSILLGVALIGLCGGTNTYGMEWESKSQNEREELLREETKKEMRDMFKQYTYENKVEKETILFGFLTIGDYPRDFWKMAHLFGISADEVNNLADENVGHFEAQMSKCANLMNTILASDLPIRKVLEERVEKRKGLCDCARTNVERAKTLRDFVKQYGTQKQQEWRD